MSALVELYLKDYYELKEVNSVNNKLLSVIDLDIAMDALADTFSSSQWDVLYLFCMGYSYREIAGLLQTGFRNVRTTHRRICKALEHQLGWDYSDAKIHRMVARRLGVVNLTPEEHKFVQIKLNNLDAYIFKQFTIYNFAFDPFGRVVFRT